MKTLISIFLCCLSFISIGQIENVDQTGIELYGEENWAFIKNYVNDERRLESLMKTGEIQDPEILKILEQKLGYVKEIPEVQRKKIEKNKYKDLDPLNDAFIPEESIWIGESKPEKFRYITDKLLIYNIWNPCDIESNDRLEELRSLSSSYPELEVIHFLHPKVLDFLSKNEVEMLWFHSEKHSPLVLGLNKKLETLVLKEGSKSFFLRNRNIQYKTDDKNPISKVFEYIELDASEDQNAYNSTLIADETNMFGYSNFLNNPQALLFDSEERELFIADTWNNRVLHYTETGELLHIIGDGFPGFKNGKLFEAQFNKPTSLAYDYQNKLLYVSDSENCAIRVVDILNETVRTCVGTGSDASIIEKEIRGREKPISKTGDLLLNSNGVYFTLPTKNVIYLYNPELDETKLVSGTFDYGVKDGKALKAMLQKPYNLCQVDNSVYFIEKDSSNLRSISKGKVKSVLINNTIESKLKFNGARGAAFNGEDLIVCDSKNHLIKKVSLNGEVEILSGGKKGYANGKLEAASFNYPVDIDIDGDNIYVLDAMNGAVRLINTASGRVTTLNLVDIDDLYMMPERSRSTRNYIELPLDSVSQNVKLMFDFSDADEIDFSSFRMDVLNSRGMKVGEYDQRNNSLDLKVDVRDYREKLTLEFSFSSCENGNCVYKRKHFYVLNLKITRPEDYHKSDTKVFKINF